MLSIVYGLTRFHTYTYGRRVTIYNDHKPLAAVLKKPIADSPVRLQRMLCRIMGYDFEFTFVKGKDLLIADALSRSQTTSQNQSKFEHHIETTRVVYEDQSVTNSLAEIAEVTAHDTELQSVVHHIYKGWTNNKRNVPIEILPYWSIKDKLSVSGGIVYRNDRIVVPVALRKTLIVKLHQEHLGTESTLRRARTSLWWPSMTNQLKQFIATCEVCNAFLTNNETVVQSRFWYFRVAERTLSSNWLTLTVTEKNLTWRETEVLLRSSIWCKNSLQDGQFPRTSSQRAERITTPLNSHSFVDETTSNTPNPHLITARAMKTLNLLWRL